MGHRRKTVLTSELRCRRSELPNRTNDRTISISYGIISEPLLLFEEIENTEKEALAPLVVILPLYVIVMMKYSVIPTLSSVLFVVNVFATSSISVM